MSRLGLAFIAIAILAGTEAFVSVGLIVLGKGSPILILNAATGFISLLVLAAGGNALFQAAKLRHPEHTSRRSGEPHEKAGQS
jgi:hypothetical protein